MTPALYRCWVRDALELAEPFALPEAALVSGVHALAGGAFDLNEHRRAVEWNLARDYIRGGLNEDTDLREWRLTPQGRAKQDSEL